LSDKYHQPQVSVGLCVRARCRGAASAEKAENKKPKVKNENTIFFIIKSPYRAQFNSFENFYLEDFCNSQSSVVGRQSVVEWFEIILLIINTSYSFTADRRLMTINFTLLTFNFYIYNDSMKRIIGIDPGLLHTGWAVIESKGAERRYIASGVILPKSKDPLPQRLAFIFNEVSKLCEVWTPDECAIEYTFVNKNPTSTLLLGHARAAAMVAVGTKNIPVYEYEPNLIKKAITGAGHADKTQIAAMVKILLPRATPKTADEADAIAIALAHSNINRITSYHSLH
jgi:crossover junction endodeoxyribonuclease RuvC